MERRREKRRPEFKPVKRGWCLGGEEFLAKLLVREGLEAMGWTEKEFPRRAKGDKGKVRLARQLRAETTMTLGWMARRLQMGKGGYVNYLLYQRRKAGKRIIEQLLNENATASAIIYGCQCRS